METHSVDRAKLIIVHNYRTSFVRIDIKLLSQAFDVREAYIKNFYSVLNPNLIRSIYETDVVIGWFASWHSFLPILLGKIFFKKTIIICGGYDTASVEKAAYGNQLNRFKRFFTNTTIKFANRVICNSNFTKKETHDVTGVNLSKIRTVYHGLQVEGIKSCEKKPVVLNVGNVSKQNLYRKGILPFCQSAELLPEFSFVQIGAWKDSESLRIIKQTKPNNCQLLGYVDDDTLGKLYAESSFYVQPSLHEGFGMSVLEAMLNRCIPIVSRYGALPEVVGDTGVILENLEPSTIAEAIRNLSKKTLDLKADAAYFRAKTMFTEEKRRKRLEDIINSLLEE